MLSLAHEDRSSEPKSRLILTVSKLFSSEVKIIEVFSIKRDSAALATAL